MLKKIVSLSAVAMIMATSVVCARVTNQTTEIQGEIISADIHNKNTNQWIPLSGLNGDINKIDADISANDIPEGEYDIIRYKHGEIKIKGVIRIEDDNPAYNGVYTTRTGHLSNGRPVFVASGDPAAAEFFTLDKGNEPNFDAAMGNLNGPEGVGGYKDGSDYYDMSKINLNITSDSNGNHVASTGNIDIIFDKSGLWFGSGWVDGIDNRYTPWVNKTFAPDTVTPGQPQTATLNDDGDIITFTDSPDGDPTKRTIMTNMIETPEMTLAGQ